MKAINVMLSNLDGKVIPIGYEGENMYTRVRINCVEIFTEYPDATVSMTISPPTGSMYPAVIEKSGVMVVWDITKSILSSNGSGSAQLTFKDGETEIKSVIFGLSINRSLIADGEPPEPVQEWIDQAEQTAEEIATRAAENVVENWDQMVSDVSALKSAFEQLDANVITESAGPAPIVSIADGADGMPMRKVEIAIEPVQDLHGYDAPWPAGGGANQFDGVWESGGLNGTTGEENPYPSFSRSVNFIAVLSNTAYYVYGSEITGTSEVFVFAYQDDGTYISYQKLESNGICTTPSNCAKIRLQVRRTIETVTNYLYAINYPNTVTTYSPYSNICPISGWTGAKVTRTGKNLLPNAMAQDTSTRVRLGESTVGDGIRLKAGTYRISYAYKDGTVPLTPYWRTVKDGVVGSINNAWVIAIDEDINVRIWLYNSQGVSVDNVEWAMVELGSTASEYEPYRGQTYEVTFPTEAGTVYGGTLDVVAGKLVVDKQHLTFTSVASVASHASGKHYWILNPTSAPVNSVNTTPQNRGLFKANQFVSGVAVVEGNSYVTYNGSMIVVVPWSAQQGILTKADADAWLANNPVEVCIPLATPVIVDLTAHEMTTLLGVNNIWADAGNTAIIYPADTKLYIDKKIAELQALILENNG